MKALKIIVLAKQVPDTRNVGKDAMKANGTINRGALPAIFNPEDLHALEQALRIKDQIPGTTVSLLTMGPVRAAEILREGLYRGADKGYLLTDRAFAGADTLATSYALSCALKQIDFDLVICGRQAIDGDTAQVGPQVAQKLGIPQVTYAEEIKAKDGTAEVLRRLDNGVETVESPMPCLITVNSSAPHCRARNAKAVMKFKRASTLTERQNVSEDYIAMMDTRPFLNIEEWGTSDVECDIEQLGLSGSPTKVKKVTNISFTAKESKVIGSTDEEIDDLMKELILNHTIG
jgi:electron transfer flavoprotein beta subunit